MVSNWSCCHYKSPYNIFSLSSSTHNTTFFPWYKQCLHYLMLLHCNVHCHVSRSSSVSRELLTISLYLSSRRRHTKLQMLHIFKLHRRRCLHSISFFLSISLFLYMLLKLMPYSRNWCCCCYYYYWRIVLCVYQISQRELNWMFHVHIT